jgi:hypothetical protein
MTRAHYWRPRQERDLGAPLIACAYAHPQRLVRLYLPPDTCTNMDGALEFALSRFPEALSIETYAGDEPDTIYTRDPREPRRWWAEFPPAPGTQAAADAAARDLIERARDADA